MKQSHFFDVEGDKPIITSEVDGEGAKLVLDLGDTTIQIRYPRHRLDDAEEFLIQVIAAAGITRAELSDLGMGPVAS